MSQQQTSVSRKNFSARLRALRGSRSQAEFAELLGIKHQQTYQRYEAGKVPSGAVLHQIAVKTGVTVDELLSSPSTEGEKAVHKRSPESSNAQPLFASVSDDGLRECIAHVLEQVKGQQGELKAFYDELLMLVIYEFCQRRKVDFKTFMRNVTTDKEPMPPLRKN